MLNAPCSMILSILPEQPVLGQICPIPGLQFLLFLFVAPFILAGVLLLVALVLFLRHGRGAAVFLILSVVFFLVGCSVWIAASR